MAEPESYDHPRRHPDITLEIGHEIYLSATSSDGRLVAVAGGPKGQKSGHHIQVVLSSRDNEAPR